MALTKDQIEARKSGIGGSDIAVILGLSPWKTAHELYLEKRGEIEPVDISDKEYIHFGNVLEQVVADEFERRNGWKVRRRNQMFTHKKLSFLLANVDRTVDGKRMVLECKISSAFANGWGPSESDEFPDFYRVQPMHYIDVLDYDSAYVATLIGGNEYRQYPVERDNELIEMMHDASADFWDCVQTGNPPEMDYQHPSTAGLIKRLHPCTDGSEIELPADIEHWHMVKKAAEVTIKNNQAVVDEATNRIAEAMGNGTIGIVPNAQYQYKRSLIRRKGYTVEPTEFMQMRGSVIRKRK